MMEVYVMDWSDPPGKVVIRKGRNMVFVLPEEVEEVIGKLRALTHNTQQGNLQ